MTIPNFHKLSLLAFLTFNTVYADIIGGEISVGMYNHAPHGHASYTLPVTGTATSADPKGTLGWDSEQDIMFKAYLEHPVPFIPNIKIGFTKLSHEGTAFTSLFSWGNIVDFSGNIDSSLDLKMSDLTVYYEILDSDIELDAGITARYISGDILINTYTATSVPLGSTGSPVLSEATSFSTLIPMLYGKARIGIPSTDISLQLETNVIRYEDTTFYDYELSARYTFTAGLGLEGGYKVLHLDSLDLEDGLNIDLDFKGFYAAIVWDF